MQTMMEDNSITNRAYQQIRAAVIGCRLPPGERVNMTAVQAEFSLSQAAVREALSRLSAEGLVEIERHRGFRIVDVSAEGFRDVTEACLVVEMPCLRSAIEHGNREWELHLISAYYRAMRTLELFVDGKEDLFGYSSEKLAFYEALFATCKNKWLLSSWRSLYTQLIRYRHMYLPLAKFELERQPDHYLNLRAVLDRDADKAVEMAIANNERVITFMEDLLAGKPASTAPGKKVRSSECTNLPPKKPQRARRPARAAS